MKRRTLEDYIELRNTLDLLNSQMETAIDALVNSAAVAEELAKGFESEEDSEMTEKYRYIDRKITTLYDTLTLIRRARDEARARINEKARISI